MAKLCCCLAGVANDLIFCDSEAVWLRIVEVIISVTLDVKFVFRAPELASSGLLIQAIVVFGSLGEKVRVLVVA